MKSLLITMSFLFAFSLKATETKEDYQLKANELISKFESRIESDFGGLSGLQDQFDQKYVQFFDAVRNKDKKIFEKTREFYVKEQNARGYMELLAWTYNWTTKMSRKTQKGKKRLFFSKKDLYWDLYGILQQDEYYYSKIRRDNLSLYAIDVVFESEDKLIDKYIDIKNKIQNSQDVSKEDLRSLSSSIRNLKSLLEFIDVLDLFYFN